MQPSARHFTLAALAVVTLCLPDPALAQVVRDNTLGTNQGLVVPGGVDDFGSGIAVDFLITPEMGETRGANLFQSLLQFDLSAGEIAAFDAGAGIDNILARVTGGARSNVDGTIRSASNANLFLLNPAGWLFGANAAIDVNASLFVGSAHFLRLDDGSPLNAGMFHASNPASDVLTIAPPSAYGFESAPASLLFNRSDSPFDFSDGLELERERTFYLAGGDIDLVGTEIRSPSGTIALVSVASAGEVPLDLSNPTEASFDALDSFQTLGHISLEDSMVDGNGTVLSLQGSARVFIRANDFQIVESTVRSNPSFLAFPGDVGGFIDIDLRGELSMSGLSRIQSLTTDAPGAPIDVHADRSDLQANSRIESTTFGTGKASDVIVRADTSISLTGAPGESFFTGISSDVVDAIGDAGSVTVTAPEIRLNSAVISSASIFLGAAEGSPGDITVLSNDLVLENEALISATNQSFAPNPGPPPSIEVRPLDPILPSSVVLVDSNIQGVSDISTADGASISVVTDRLLLRGLSAIKATALAGFGNAGSITIDADSVELRNSSTIQSDTQLNFGFLFLLTNGDPFDDFLGLPIGNAGDITITANELVIDGRNPVFAFGVPIRPEISTTSFGAGDGGVISIDLRSATGNGQLTLIDGVIRSGLLTAATEIGQQPDIATFLDLSAIRAGDIGIDADVIRVQQGGSIVSEAGFLTLGSGGTVRVDATRTLEVSGTGIIAPSTISSATAGAGDGGAVSVSAPKIRILDHATISTGSLVDGGGRAGDLSVVAGNQVTLRRGALIEATSRGSDGGSILVTAGKRISVSASRIRTDVRDGVGGNLTLDAKVVDLANSALTATAGDGAGGVITIRSELFFNSHSTLDASAGPAGIDGVVVVESPEVDIAGDLNALPSDIQDVSSQLPPRCVAQAQRQPSSFSMAVYRPGQADPDSLFILPSQRADGTLDASSSPDAPRPAAELAEAQEQLYALRELSEDRASEGDLEGAEQALSRGLAIISDPATAADFKGRVATLQARRSAYAEAIDSLESAAASAASVGHFASSSGALASAGRLAAKIGETDRSIALFERAHAQTPKVTDTRIRGDILLHLGLSSSRIAEQTEDSNAEALLYAYRTFGEVAQLTASGGEPRLRSLALGGLGHLYELEGRAEEALRLTAEALREARSAADADAIYRAKWQMGRLLYTQGRAQLAVASLREAVAVLDETRQSQVRDGDAEAAFRRNVAPVYLDLVSALLQSSERVAAEAQPGLWREARAVVESLKAAELRNYFRDDCIAAMTASAREIEQISGSAAVIYPVLMRDRVEQLVSVAGEMRRYTLAIRGAALTKKVEAFRRSLSSGVSWSQQAAARELYDLLIRPMLADLEAAGVDTLVFVPDGALRTIPMGALHDGEHFLIEQYAIAVTPGLTLIDPVPFDRKNPELLLVGVSEGVQGFPALPAVGPELAAVQSIYGGKVLLDADFDVASVTAELASREPSILHIASHGVFTGDPATSFLLAYDEKINMNQLSEIVGTTRFRDQPLELLVLSACETAAGDERSALGLAGVAIKAGARSALGSLWTIGDEATQILIEEFYTQLKDPSISKARALQLAQVKLLENPKFEHPRYWSPYLIISNWL